MNKDGEKKNTPKVKDDEKNDLNVKDDKKKDFKKKKNKKNQNNKKIEEDISSKHIGMIIFSVLIVFLIIYVIYSYEAYKNGWFPFSDYVTIPPAKGTYQPTVNPTSSYKPTNEYSDQQERLEAAGFKVYDKQVKEDLADKINDILTTNCAWWCKGQLSKGGTGFGVTNTPKIGFNNNTSLNARFNSIFARGDDVDTKSLYFKQDVNKPAGDTSKGPGCDCVNGNYVLEGPEVQSDGYAEPPFPK